MHCPNCQRDIADYSKFCYFCGARQPNTTPPARANRRLLRSRNRVLGGVCSGVAEYMDTDPAIVRLVWVLLVILPIPFVPAILGYLVAWLVIPSAPAEGSAAAAAVAAAAAAAPAADKKRLTRSRTDRQFGGVCGGLGEFMGVDSTVVRVIWSILTIVPGAIIGGILAYFIAWLIMPEAPAEAPVTAQPQQAAS
ncbi:MAG TPA: PspC domain-containing protein [Candidatus Acidoferrales bacterium]